MSQILQKNPRSLGLLLIAVIALAVNLRTPLVAVAPVVNDIRQSLGASGSIMGLLASLPIFVFALFSPFVAKLAQRFGMENTLLASIALLLLGITLRSIYPSLMLLLLGTFILAVAISVGNVLLPALAKQGAAQRVGLVIGAFSITMALSSTFASAVAVPIAETLNWQWSLGIWAVFTLFALLIWGYLRFYTQSYAEVAQTKPTVTMWKKPQAWLISFFFGIQSLLFYALMNFLPSVLVEKGFSSIASGNYASLLQAMGLVGILVVSTFFAKIKAKQAFTLTICLLFLSGILGLWQGSPNLMWLWVSLIGFGTSTFSITLMLLPLKTNSPQQATALSGMSQAIGYGIAGFGPLLIGLMFDYFGSWSASLSMLVILMLIECCLAWQIAKPELITD